MHFITHPLVILILVTAAANASAQVGALDPTFDGDGKVITDFGVRDYAGDVVVTADGTIFVAGSHQGSTSTNTRNAFLARYTTDGVLDGDWDFFEQPCGNVPEGFDAIEITGANEVVAGGYSQFDCSGPERDFWNLRVRDDGTALDRFDRPNLGLTDLVSDLELQPDGKMIAVGFSSSTSSSSTYDLAVVRYLDDGSIDAAGFGTNGMVKIDVVGEQDRLMAVERQPDGKIVAVGFSTDTGSYDWVLLRLNEDGTNDTTFGTDGLVVTDFFGYDDEARDLVILPDGRIVVVGYRVLDDGSTAELIVARFSADGAIDGTFGVGGVVTVDFGLPSAWGWGIARQLDGKLIVAGSTETGAGGLETRDFAVARLNADGTLDPTFNGTGMNTVDFGGGQEDVVRGIAIQPDGDIVVVGLTRFDVGGSDQEDIAMARFNGGKGETPLFFDGFESGDTSVWAETQ